MSLLANPFGNFVRQSQYTNNVARTEDQPPRAPSHHCFAIFDATNIEKSGFERHPSAFMISDLENLGDKC